MNINYVYNVTYEVESYAAETFVSMDSMSFIIEAPDPESAKEIATAKLYSHFKKSGLLPSQMNTAACTSVALDIEESAVRQGRFRAISALTTVAALLDIPIKHFYCITSTIIATISVAVVTNLYLKESLFITLLFALLVTLTNSVRIYTILNNNPKFYTLFRYIWMVTFAFALIVAMIN